MRLFAALAAAVAVFLAQAVAASPEVKAQKMDIQWSKITNPFHDTEPEVSVRDPLLHYDNGVFRCFYSAVEFKEGNYTFCLEMITSPDLVHWSMPKRLTHSFLGFSSPGNIVRRGDDWIMSVQSYLVLPGQTMACEEARLWFMRSKDLDNWSDPIPIYPQGAHVNWSDSRRQIDPCFMEQDGKWWCIYKNSGKFGMLVSDDFKKWTEASPDRPVMDRSQTPDNATVENPCIWREGDEWIMIFSPCHKGRGIGVARSKDLLNWTGIHYLDFPAISWADNGPSAAMVADLRDVCGKYVMVFHGERRKVNGHAAALGIAWSDDLEHWTVPGSGE